MHGKRQTVTLACCTSTSVARSLNNSNTSITWRSRLRISRWRFSISSITFYGVGRKRTKRVTQVCAEGQLRQTTLELVIALTKCDLAPGQSEKISSARALDHYQRHLACTLQTIAQASNTKRHTCKFSDTRAVRITSWARPLSTISSTCWSLSESSTVRDGQHRG